MSGELFFSSGTTNPVFDELDRSAASFRLAIEHDDDDGTLNYIIVGSYFISDNALRVSEEGSVSLSAGNTAIVNILPASMIRWL